MVNIGNSGNVNFTHLKAGQDIKQMKNLNEQEKKIFMHFAGKDGILQQDEIDEMVDLIDDYTIEDDELSNKDAQKIIKQLKQGDSSGLKGVKGKDLVSFLQMLETYDTGNKSDDITVERDGNNVVVTNTKTGNITTYDNNGNIVERTLKTEKDGVTYSMTKDDNGSETRTWTDKDGKVTTEKYKDKQILTQTVETKDQIKTTNYDPKTGKPQNMEIKDNNDNTTQVINYDENNNVTDQTTTYPKGTTRKSEYFTNAEGKQCIKETVTNTDGDVMIYESVETSANNYKQTSLKIITKAFNQELPPTKENMQKYFGEIYK